MGKEKKKTKHETQKGGKTQREACFTSTYSISFTTEEYTFGGLFFERPLRIDFRSSPFSILSLLYTAEKENEEKSFSNGLIEKP